MSTDDEIMDNNPAGALTGTALIKWWMYLARQDAKTNDILKLEKHLALVEQLANGTATTENAFQETENATKLVAGLEEAIAELKEKKPKVKL